MFRLFLKKMLNPDFSEKLIYKKGKPDEKKTTFSTVQSPKILSHNRTHFFQSLYINACVRRGMRGMKNYAFLKQKNAY